MDTSPAHLRLAHEGPIPLDVLDAFEAAVAVDGVVVRREARLATRASASMTLLMFTGVGLFLTKAYFDALSSALRQAHAPTLEAALCALAHRLSALPVRRQPAAAPAVTDRFSPFLTVWIARDADSWFKMLIPLDLSPEALDAAQKAYLTFAHAYHTGALDPADVEILMGLRPLEGVVLMTYDAPSGTIEPVDLFEGRGVDRRR